MTNAISRAKKEHVKEYMDVTKTIAAKNTIIANATMSIAMKFPYLLEAVAALVVEAAALAAALVQVAALVQAEALVQVAMVQVAMIQVAQAFSIPPIAQRMGLIPTTAS